MKVILLGSSRLLMKNGLTESLAGRYELIRMPHWSYGEMKDASGIDLSRYIFFGGYPGGASFTDNERRWRHYIKDSIIAPAMEYDILMTKIVYKPELMRRLFELGCVYSGEEISLNKLLGQLQDVGNVTTLASYLTTLDESRMLCGLQLYYWRNRDDEVDFVIEYNHRCIAIEVKSGRRTTNDGIRVFKEKFSPAQTFIVGSGGIPIEEFLTINPVEIL